MVYNVQRLDVFEPTNREPIQSHLNYNKIKYSFDKKDNVNDINISFSYLSNRLESEYGRLKT